MRLLSWNIHKGIGGRDRRYSLDRIITCIEAENPDLICLQEVDRHVARSQHHDQPRLLARYFRCHAVFQPTVAVADGGYGNLVLSRCVRPPRPYASRSFFRFSVPDQRLAAARRLARLTIFASARASRSSTL